MRALAEVPDLRVEVGAVRLGNPVIPASGTFGLGHGRILPLSRLGALVPKTVMPTPRPGHPPRRLAEAAGGLINAIGIPSAGFDDFLRDALPRWLAHGPPVIVSVSADSADGFAAMASRLDASGAAAIELNLSCPNLEEGGRAFALDPAPTAQVTSACRRACALPLWCKLSPNAAAPADVARAAAAAGADALVVANTLTALALADGRPVLANRTGGLSGMPLKPINLRLVDDVARAVALPIVGCGGIATFTDALDYFAVGASAVAVGTATLSRPLAMVHLIDALERHCAERGIRARDLIRSGR